MKLVVGLGNPGQQYEGTRHNLGFMVIDELSRSLRTAVDQDRFHAMYGTVNLEHGKVILAKPTTFVNRSGQAVLALMQFYKIELSDLLIITDDLALPLGKLRIRVSGSSGGHNGLLDISQRLGTEDFARLRIGIDAPAWQATDHVLGRFGSQELPVVVQAVGRAADAVTVWLRQGMTIMMNQFNRDPQTDPKKNQSSTSDDSSLEEKP